MAKNSKEFHGSDVETIEKLYKINKEELKNFSSNVNPLGLSNSVKNAIIENIDLLESYSDRENNELKKAIAKYTNCDINNIFVGNGVSEIMKIVIKTISPKKAIIIGPTYSEYEKELSILGANVEYFELKEIDDFQINIEDLFLELDKGFDMLVICNPNNPTSTLIDIEKMEMITRYCVDKNTVIMVDETYIEFVNDYKSCINLTNKNYWNLIILRGVSKFFALPGIRFGYGITSNRDFLENIDSQNNTWSVNSLVLPSFKALSNDTKYIKISNDLIASEKDRIINRLSNVNSLKIIEPKANFVLIKIKNNMTSKKLFEMAIKRNIMIRDCSSFVFLNDKFFRFCLLSKEDNDILLDFLESTFM